MTVSGQLHALAALSSGKEPQVYLSKPKKPILYQHEVSKVLAIIKGIFTFLLIPTVCFCPNELPGNTWEMDK
jgi:hypothetical protein